MSRAKRIVLIGPDGPAMSRRLFLRDSLLGAAALGAAVLSAPAAAQYGGGAGAMPGAGARPGAGPAPGGMGGMARAKVSKAAARYRNRPNGSQRCGRCTHFLGPNGCEIVAGPISPNGWSRYFKPAA